MGRKRKSGQRTKSGRLSRSSTALVERNPPSDSVIARQERFRHFRGDGSIGTEMTCAGRLMLVGAFDGLEIPAETLLSELLQYSDAYWSHYTGLCAGIATYERQDRGHDSKWSDPQGEWFDRKDALLTAAGRDVRKAVMDVSVDRHWFPDEDVSWAARIINSRILHKRQQLAKAKRDVPSGLCVVGELAGRADWEMLSLLRQGAMALAGAELKRAA